MVDRKTVEGWNLKRLAWAYGCSQKGSLEESQLEEALLLRCIEYPERHAKQLDEQDEIDPYASSQNLE